MDSLSWSRGGLPRPERALALFEARPRPRAPDDARDILDILEDLDVLDARDILEDFDAFDALEAFLAVLPRRVADLALFLLEPLPALFVDEPPRFAAPPERFLAVPCI
jgi:hypothetical protein